MYIWHMGACTHFEKEWMKNFLLRLILDEEYMSNTGPAFWSTQPIT